MLVGCNRTSTDFEQMKIIAEGAETYLGRTTNAEALHWAEFRADFPRALPEFKIVESENGPTLVWCSLHATTNKLQLTYAVPLYWDGSKWTHRNGRWTVAAVEERGGFDSQHDLQLEEWERLRRGNWHWER
jgi:hypothetical protein